MHGAAGEGHQRHQVTVCSSSEPPPAALLRAAAALEAACFPLAFAGGAAEAEAALRRALTQRRCALLLCCDAGGTLLGFALVQWTVGAGSLAKARASLMRIPRASDAADAGAAQLAVAPAARRRGVGAALLRHALDALSGAGAQRATLRVAADGGGDAARRLYARAGFRPQSDDRGEGGGKGDDALQRDYYGKGRHALLMAADLAS